MTNQWGGKRKPGPGKKIGRPKTRRDVTYRRPAIEPPATPEEEAALKAFSDLKPPERLEVIVRWHRRAGEPGQGQEGE